MGVSSFFRPRTVAVVGAARQPEKVGHIVLANLLSAGFKGEVYPVNPRAKEILGRPCFSSVTDIPDTVDLAVIVVPAKSVAGIIGECADAGIPAAIVISAGFKESGPQGGAIERAVLEKARAGGVRLLGPNCLGVVSTPCGLNASFAGVMPPSGGVSFMSQSGALGTAILDLALTEGIGLAHFVSLGNRADVSEADLLSTWADDPDTDVVVAYLESVADGSMFLDAARGFGDKKPFVVVKAGVSDAGGRAVSSHTGSLAGSDTAYEAAFKQAGIIRARTVQQLFDLASAFSHQPLPAGDGVAILTNAGGPGVLATDAADLADLALASLEAETIDRLRAVLPSAAALYNPIDILGDAGPDRYAAALKTLEDDPGVRSLLVILSPQAMTDPDGIARVVTDSAQRSGLTTLACFMGQSSVSDAWNLLREGSVPNYPFPERAVATLASMHVYSRRRSLEQDSVPELIVHAEMARQIVASMRSQGRDLIAEQRAADIAAAFGIPVPAGELAGDLSSAIDAAECIGYPVALKIASPDLLHKSDIGGIRLGIDSAQELASAYDDILGGLRSYAPDSVVDGVHVQRMVPSGREVIVGVDRDPVFGPLLMFGLGGIYVEILGDVTFRLVPVSPAEAHRMVSETRSFGLLRGARGQRPADIDAIIDTIVRVSELVIQIPEIEELDINPLIVGNEGDGVFAADVRIGIGGT